MVRRLPSWIQTCFYNRYIDDTFFLFKTASHIPKFLQYFNLKHSSIEFTSDVEINSKLSFLDILIHNKQKNWNFRLPKTKVYRIRHEIQLFYPLLFQK